MKFTIVEEAKFGDPESYQRTRTVTVELEIDEGSDAPAILAEARTVAKTDLDDWADQHRIEGYANSRRAMISQVLNLYNSGEDEVAAELEAIVMADLAGVSDAEAKMIKKEFGIAKQLGELSRKHDPAKQKPPHGGGAMPPSGGFGRRRSRN